MTEEARAAMVVCLVGLTKGVAGGTRTWKGLGVKYKVTTSQFVDPLEQIN